MTAFRIVTVPGLILAAALGACSTGNYAPEPAKQTSAAEYRPDNQAYIPNHRRSTSAGMVMTTPRGETVYTSDNDQPGKSSCYGDCARNWPPVLAGNEAKPYGRMSLAARDDGQRQWAYDGMPLYTFTADQMFGDVKGDNLGSDWHVVR